jgi:preprotein translocase subunit SecA
MANFLTKIFNEDARKVKKIEKKVQPILDLEKEYRAMSDEQLKAKTPELKQKLADGATPG